MLHHTNDIEKRSQSVAYKAFRDYFSSTGDITEAKEKASEVFHRCVIELGLLEVERFIFERRYDERKKRKTYRGNRIQRKNRKKNLFERS